MASDIVQFMKQIGQVLAPYATAEQAQWPQTIESDFKWTIKHLPPNILEPVISYAIKSHETPSFSQTLIPLYEKQKFQKRAEILNSILEVVPELGLTYINQAEIPVTVKSVSKIPIENVGRIFSTAEESFKPQVIEATAHYLANRPKVLLDLDQKIRGVIFHTASTLPEIAEVEKVLTGEPLIEEIRLAQSPAEIETGVDKETVSAPLPRYASVQVFEEDRPHVRGNELPSGAVFKEGKWYEAEVSVRRKPVGVKPVDEHRPIREPKQHEPVDILVTALSKDFKIVPRLSKLVLPPKGDSTQQAVFRIQPTRSSRSADDPLRICFRLFYKLNMIEKIVLRGGASPYIDDLPDITPPSVELVYARFQQSEANDFDLMAPRQMHIEVEPDEQQYTMVFTFEQKREDDDPKFPVSVPLTALQLEPIISSIRKALFRVCASDTLAARVDGDESEFNEHVRELAKKGSDLWSKLFKKGEDQEISIMGEWLTNNPLPEGSTIQVSISTGPALSFVFAWNSSLRSPHRCRFNGKRILGYALCD